MVIKRGRIEGVTLIELMIVLVIVGILATIAYPTYVNSVRKSRRADGIAALTNVQLVEEKLRASCPHYGENLGGANNVCGADPATSTLKASATSSDGHYAITLTGVDEWAYTVTATGQGDQANDEAGGVTCTLVLTVTTANPNGVRTPAACWPN